MCIGIPGKIILIKREKAEVEQEGHSHWVDISSLGEKIKIGDYLISYQNVAINKVSPKDAEEILKMMGPLMNGASDTGVKSPD